MKKLTALFLALALCLSLCTVTAFAAVTLLYSFDFETDPFSEANGWTSIDADGDGYDWETDTDEAWDLNLDTDRGHCAVSMSAYYSWPYNADNWMFSPAITIPAGGAKVSWYERSQDPSYPDYYEVYVSATNTSTDTNLMTQLYSGTAANPWAQKTAELSAKDYAGKTVYIAFRHVSYDCFWLEIDNFAVEANYTVTFDANGHGTAPASYTDVASGTKISKPTDPTAPGYTFGGWYKETGCTNAWNFDTDTVATDTTLYAKWTATGGGNPNPGHGYSAPSGHLVTSDLTSVTKVTVDGKVVDSKYYTVSGGNVTLTDAFMKTLANGKHTVKLYNGDVVATGTMTISGNAAVVSAKTADAGIALYGVLSVSSLLGMGWVSKKKR